MPEVSKIKLSDYQYILPDERVAKFPLAKRDESKLLHFEDGKISHVRFKELPDLIPSDSLVVFNNTKVIPARIFFIKPTGAKIEIFLLKPVEPTTEINVVMLSRGPVIWETMIGNLKRWKEGETLKGELVLDGNVVSIEATLVNRDSRLVSFTWSGSMAFCHVIEACGEVPLPPYLNRAAVAEDKPRYQTVYSKKQGAVAAPTAGLHFTPQTLTDISDKGILLDYLTLHVSAGTFQPIKEESVDQHPMHSEQVIATRTNIQNILEAKKNILAVGTTSMRSLESLYWYGVKLIEGEDDLFFIPKLYPYREYKNLPNVKESFKAILDHMNDRDLDEITGSTEIFIMPGYDFKVCNGLVTNFHQPGSTLILLVAAFTQGNWRKIYDEAMSGSYRFLSYGDSSLLWYNKIA
ncbi:S-adenosylmethionine:tRNA ribosyltransferase-isomerase [Anditalea andensis]|uniref:S-adenosylmethionine:tRNA ribosyltransferase-isomerase n=1 Tax=Anditalea andensis TaxID=1048983 RepID=A0A074KZ53_9BACT|nr:S-adenosylmethionine:tRNA ribosyltransferase-isomerase [Anditalea andensis]KEO74189.1 S-adenosylmethionine tRNA ribosyltransferase [Anditalea andensis]